MDIPTALLPLSGLALSLYNTVQGRFISRDQAKREERVTVLEKQMALFWKMVEQHMTTVLHSPHTPDLDKLLEKYQAGEELSNEEATELSQRLVSLINDSSEVQGNRAGAVFLLAALNVRYKLGEFDPCVEGE